MLLIYVHVCAMSVMLRPVGRSLSCHGSSGRNLDIWTGQKKMKKMAKKVPALCRSKIQYISYGVICDFERDDFFGNYVLDYPHEIYIFESQNSIITT